LHFWHIVANLNERIQFFSHNTTFSALIQESLFILFQGTQNTTTVLLLTVCKLTNSAMAPTKKGKDAVDLNAMLTKGMRCCAANSAGFILMATRSPASQE
jgi:hypothetical protein